MARRALAPEAQGHQQAVQKECAVNGSVLAVSVLHGAEMGVAARAQGLRANLSRRGSVMDTGRLSSVRSPGRVWCAGCKRESSP